jgi:hypothetical protein
MNIIFLDIDGVLKNHTQKNELFGYSRDNLLNLKKIIDTVPNIKIVLSTYHRNYKFNLNKLKIVMNKNGINYDKYVVAKTANLEPIRILVSDEYRTREIKDFVIHNRSYIRKWVALDDLNLKLQPSNFIRTNYNCGLTYKNAVDAIRCLL